MKEDSFLKKVGQNRPYTVPEGYFDNLEKAVLSNVSASSSSNVRKMYTRRFIWASAAVIATLIGGFLWYLNVEKTLTSDINWADNQTIENYIEANIDSFDESLLLEFSDNLVKIDWTDESEYPEDMLIDMLLDELSIDELEGLTL